MPGPLGTYLNDVTDAMLLSLFSMLLIAKVVISSSDTRLGVNSWNGRLVPFVVSTDGVLGFNANNLLLRIAKNLAEKWDLPYSQICRRATVSIAIALTTHLCLRGSGIPASKPFGKEGLVLVSLRPTINTLNT